MTLDGVPISTGGLYHHVGLLDKAPHLKVYKHWLALVYTIPKQRNQGYGALICQRIQHHSKSIGIDKLYLFTDTAERLYRRLGWAEIESLSIDSRNIVVMEKT
jgi:GNAT superfamily N-acetyltransferase